MNTFRTRGSKLYPTDSWKKPANNGGGWFQLNRQWRFVYNGYMDKIFCRRNLQNSNFTIVWYHYQIGYPVGVKTLLADAINNNYIRYDYDTQEMLIDFNNFHKRVNITLPEFIWCQFSIRFNFETNELIIGFIDFFHERYEEISVDVGPGTLFELTSLWGRYDKELGHYTEIQKGLFGFLIIHQNIIETEDLRKWFNNHKEHFGIFDPRYMVIPDIF
jgi:hypothetical protein